MNDSLSTRSRIERLAAGLRQAHLDAFLCTSPVTMGYLQGFFEEGGERLLMLAVSSRGQVRMICPGLTEAQARRCGIEDVRPWLDGDDPWALFRLLAADWGFGAGRVAVDNDMAAAHLLAAQAAIPEASFAAGQPVMSDLMRVKSGEELELMLRAGKIADDAFSAALGQLRPGLTEQEAAGILLESMRRLGGTPTFCIAAGGKNSAEPHHHSDDTVLEEGNVLILDFGCSVSGYQSDITRTVCLGEAGAEAKALYDVVLRAHQAGRAAIRPGVACQAIDRAARRVIEDAGFGPFFVHRTGHGIGMRGHEEPYIVEGNGQLLAPGHCFSVEPGVYLPGRFGIRIENCVACAPEGHLSLNEEPAGRLLELR